MQKMKRGKGCDFDFVEIMACPSGCVNGGGEPIKGAELLFFVCEMLFYRNYILLYIFNYVNFFPMDYL